MSVRGEHLTVSNAADLIVIPLSIPLMSRVLARVNSPGRVLVLRAQSHEQHINGGLILQNAVLEKVSQISVTNYS